jgi:YVTN family beta-propeller protein
MSRSHSREALLAARRFSLAAVLAALTLSPHLTPAPSAAQTAAGPKAYVGLFQDNAVAVLDTSSQRVLSTVAVPAGPHGIVVTPDGRKVYVSSDGASTVSVVDTARDQVTASVEVGAEPHGLAITPDGRQVLVGGWGANQVLLIDTATDRVVGELPVAKAHNIAVSPDGRLAYVGSQEQGALALAILDLASRTQVGRVPLEQTPRGLSFSPDGRWLYLTQAGVDAVAVLDVASNQFTAQIPIGPSPHFPLFTPDGSAGLVDSQGLHQLARLDPATQTVSGVVAVGQRPHWTATSGDGRTAYVTNEGSNDVSVVDLASLRVTATIPVGNAPRKVAVQPGAPSMGRADPMRAGTTASLPAAPALPAVAAPAAVATRIDRFAFEPTITAAPHQTITWTNADAVPHTVTSADRVWASGNLANGDTYSVALDAPGTYAYFCSLHPYMRGTVVVAS